MNVDVLRFLCVLRLTAFLIDTVLHNLAIVTALRTVFLEEHVVNLRSFVMYIKLDVYESLL